MDSVHVTVDGSDHDMNLQCNQWMRRNMWIHTFTQRVRRDIFILCARCSPFFSLMLQAKSDLAASFLRLLHRAHARAHTHTHGRTSITSNQLVVEAATYTTNTREIIRDLSEIRTRDPSSRSSDIGCSPLLISIIMCFIDRNAKRVIVIVPLIRYLLYCNADVTRMKY